MATLLPDIELKQAFEFFSMGTKSLNTEEYLTALKNVGVVYNKAETQAIMEREKKTYTEADFLKDYKEKMAILTRDYLLKVFEEFDPESTGIIAYDVLHRALVSYGERLSKEEADRFMHAFKLKPGENIQYNDLLDQMILI